MKGKQQTLAAGDLSLFCSQAAMLLKSGIPLDDGLEAIRDTLPDSGKEIIGRLVAGYHESYSLEQAMEASGVFPPYLVQMVGIGERSGKLEEVFASLGSYYERDARMKGQIRRAVFYPMISICAMAVVVAVLVWKVLPIFREVLSSLGAVSGTAGALMELGPVLGIAVLVLLGILILAAAAGALLFRLGKGGWIRALFVKIPPVRRTLEKVSASRFASVLSMLLSSGYQMEEALSFLPAILPDRNSAEKVRRIGERIGQGETVPDAVEAEGIFPGLYGRMVAIGQRAGSLDSVMEKLASLYEEEADNAIQSLIGLLEPLLVGILSLAVGAILFSVMLPLLGVMSSIG